MAGIPVAPIVTVTTAAETYDLTTLARVKLELGITDGSKNELLTDLIKETSAIISEYCGRVFASETVEEKFFPFRDDEPRVISAGPKKLQVARWPISAVASLTENGTVLVEDTDFIVDYKNGQLIRLGGDGYPGLWPTSPIVVDYTGGYLLLPSLPRGIERACIEFVRLKYYATKRDPLVKQESIPEVYSATYAVSETGAAPIPPSIAGLIAIHRTPVTGAA